MEIPSDLIEHLKAAKSVVFFSGAGISAESGIPTFRGKNGIWNKFRPEELANFDAFTRGLVAEFHVVDAGRHAGPIHRAHHVVAEAVIVHQAAVANGHVDHLDFEALAAAVQMIARGFRDWFSLTPPKWFYAIITRDPMQFLGRYAGAGIANTIWGQPTGPGAPSALIKPEPLNLLDAFDALELVETREKELAKARREEAKAAREAAEAAKKLEEAVQSWVRSSRAMNPVTPAAWAWPKEEFPEEMAFRSWYEKVAQQWDLDPDPYNPLHYYDYKAAWRAGAYPDIGGHWPSTYKKLGHPNLIVEGRNTPTGEPIFSEIPNDISFRVPGSQSGDQWAGLFGGRASTNTWFQSGFVAPTSGWSGPLRRHVRRYLPFSLAHRPHEIFVAVWLDAQHRVLKMQELFAGTLTQTSIYPREVVKDALLHNAAAVIFAHYVAGHKMRVMCRGSLCSGTPAVH